MTNLEDDASSLTPLRRWRCVCGVRRLTTPEIKFAVDVRAVRCVHGLERTEGQAWTLLRRRLLATHHHTGCRVTTEDTKTSEVVHQRTQCITRRALTNVAVTLKVVLTHRRNVCCRNRTRSLAYSKSDTSTIETHCEKGNARHQTRQPHIDSAVCTLFIAAILEPCISLLTCDSGTCN
jgi:hypothetical protein